MAGVDKAGSSYLCNTDLHAGLTTDTSPVRYGYCIFTLSLAPHNCLCSANTDSSLTSVSFLADVSNDTASTGASGLHVSDNTLSPDNNASSILASPVSGLLPELSPNAMEDGVALFLLQVSGRDALEGNDRLNQELYKNLVTRLIYVNDSNLYLLNYTQVPTGNRRSLLADANAPSSPPPPLGEIQTGVVPLPDLQAETQNISVQGTGVQIKGPSMTFMYEVVAENNAHIVNINNQLNSIIATTLLLKDVQAANLSISSIYLLAFQPGLSASVDNTSASLGRSSSKLPFTFS